MRGGTNVRTLPLANVVDSRAFFYTSEINGVYFARNGSYETWIRNKDIDTIDQSQLYIMNETYSRVIDLSSNLFKELPLLDRVNVRELNLEYNQISQLVDSRKLPESIEVNQPIETNKIPSNLEFLLFKVLNFANNSIHSIDENFFKLFDKLRHVNLNQNKLRSIDTLYFNSDYLYQIQIGINKDLERINRFVFSNSGIKGTINDLKINLALNNLKRLPKLYGNVRRIKIISMVGQRNKLPLIDDYFLDNSAPFKTSDNVESNLLIVTRALS